VQQAIRNVVGHAPVRWQRNVDVHVREIRMVVHVRQICMVQQEILGAEQKALDIEQKTLNTGQKRDSRVD
jgi:hypothetical protein